MEGEVPALFARVAGVGPFFAVATGPAPPGGGWVPVGGLPGPHLTARIAAVRAALRTDDRVAASIAFQGLAAQLVAPLFGAAVLGRALPEPSGIPAALHWRPGGAGPWLWWAGGDRLVPCPGGAVLGDALLDLLAPLVAAVRAQVPVSGRVLWGDAASAVASARRLVAAEHPGAAARAGDLARLLLATAPLAATAAFRPPEAPDRSWTFRRRSCCLYHRVPGGGLCADCVLLDRRPGTRAPGP